MSTQIGYKVIADASFPKLIKKVNVELSKKLEDKFNNESFYWEVIGSPFYNDDIDLWYQSMVKVVKMK